MSFSGNLPSPTQNKVNLYQRNALSTVKKPERKTFHSRKNLVLKPLDLDAIKREMEQASQSPEPFMMAIMGKSPETKEDSFQLDFEELPVETPVKPNAKAVKFATPCVFLKKPSDKEPPDANSAKLTTPRICLTTPFTRKPSDNQFSTPTNKKLQTFQATPINVNNLYTLDEEEDEEEEKGSKILKINNVKYKVVKELGKGGSSEVLSCVNLSKDLMTAVKVVSLKNKNSATGFINEVEMLKTLQNCDHIIKIEIKENVLLVVLEVGETDLRKILKKWQQSSTHMPLFKLLSYWMEMLYAVKQIHSHGIIHFDLKPANFLLVQGELKLIDFGIARTITDDETSVIKPVMEGSYNYISPEALSNQSSSNVNSPSYSNPKYKLSYKSDVWSLGCILYQMVYKKSPFEGIKHIWAKLTAIADPNHKIEYPEADWTSRKIVDTMKKCLQKNMKSRPSVDELIMEYEHMYKNFM